MLRSLLFLHRYLAVAVGLLMALWCLSGFVMMYQPFPELTSQERLAGLAPLRFERCCSPVEMPGRTTGDWRIEMLGETPVLRQGDFDPVLLSTGHPVPAIEVPQLQAIVSGHAARRGLDGSPRRIGEVELDQWTIQSARRNAPVHHFALDDAAGTELYVNGRTGEVFQDTTRRERVLSWLGAIPHWLYPTALRRHAALWSQVVIWTSVLGTFLVASGFYVGISRLRRDRQGQVASPYRGWWYWHHMTGLVFGLLALTWVSSGLLTMNPWGWLQGDGTTTRLRAQLAGQPQASGLQSFLQAAPAMLQEEEFRALRAAPFGGRLHVLAQRADGSSLRLDEHARPAPLHADEVRTALADLDVPLASLELIEAEDAYYYARRQQASLPVWRAVLDDAAGTRIYLDAVTGAARVVDAAAMQARWFTQGLHSLDFRGLRSRPLWDVVVLLLLAGVSALCVTGSWMAIQRLRRDLFSRS